MVDEDLQSIAVFGEAFSKVIMLQAVDDDYVVATCPE